MIFIIKAGRPFFAQAGAQGFGIAPLFRFQYFVSGFSAIMPQELRLSTLLLNYRSLWRTWL